jgi:hypothetical protein
MTCRATVEGESTENTASSIVACWFTAAEMFAAQLRSNERDAEPQRTPLATPIVWRLSLRDAFLCCVCTGHYLATAVSLPPQFLLWIGHSIFNHFHGILTSSHVVKTTQLANTFLAFTKLIVVFTKAHWNLSWSCRFQMKPPLPISSISTSRPSKRSLPFRFCHQSLCISWKYYATILAHLKPSCFNHLNNITPLVKLQSSRLFYFWQLLII